MKGGGDRPGKQLAWINQVVEGSLLHDLAYFWPEISMVSLILKRKKTILDVTLKPRTCHCIGFLKP